MSPPALLDDPGVTGTTATTDITTDITPQPQPLEFEDFDRRWSHRLRETALVYLPLGWISFGGPTAHIGLFHQLFVDKLRWLNERTFTEFFGICQALPGPASTQMAYGMLGRLGWGWCRRPCPLSC